MGLLEANIREQLWNSEARHMSSLESSGDRALDRPVLLWGVRGGEPAPDPEAVAVVHKHAARVLDLVVQKMRGTPMSTMKRFIAERNVKAIFSQASYGCCRRQALSTNMTYLDPPSDAE